MEPASQAAIVQHVNDIVQYVLPAQRAPSLVPILTCLYLCRFIHLHMATFLGSVAYEPASPQYVRLVE